MSVDSSVTCFSTEFLFSHLWCKEKNAFRSKLFAGLRVSTQVPEVDTGFDDLAFDGDDSRSKNGSHLSAFNGYSSMINRIMIGMLAVLCCATVQAQPGRGFGPPGGRMGPPWMQKQEAKHERNGDQKDSTDNAAVKRNGPPWMQHASNHRKGPGPVDRDASVRRGPPWMKGPSLGDESAKHGAKGAVGHRGPAFMRGAMGMRGPSSVGGPMGRKGPQFGRGPMGMRASMGQRGPMSHHLAMARVMSMRNSDRSRGVSGSPSNGRHRAGHGRRGKGQRDVGGRHARHGGERHARGQSGRKKDHMQHGSRPHQGESDVEQRKGRHSPPGRRSDETRRNENHKKSRGKSDRRG